MWNGTLPEFGRSPDGPHKQGNGPDPREQKHPASPSISNEECQDSHEDKDQKNSKQGGLLSARGQRADQPSPCID